MRLAVVLVFAVCAVGASRDESAGSPDKPGYAQTENPDKQVEYVTGPNVGIVGPTVLGGKGQEVQPSGEELQATDKEQRDVSAHYSDYQQTSARLEDRKEQPHEASYPKYSYSEGMKYFHRQEQSAANQKEPNEKKNQVIQIGNVHRPTKITYYQSRGSYPQAVRSEQGYYEPQNQELGSAQLLTRIQSHQLSQLLNHGPTEYKQGAVQNHGQEERGLSQSQAEKTDAPSSSTQEAHLSEEGEGQQAPPTNAAPVYIPQQEYLQYQIAAAQGDLQSTLRSPGNHLLQLFLPQEGQVHLQAEPQVTPTVQSNIHLQPIQNEHQIQYIPTYYSSPQPGQRVLHPPPQKSTEIRPIHPQPASNLQNGHLSNLPSYSRTQHPEIYSNFQPSRHPLSTFSNEPTQYHLLQQSNEASRRPQKIYLQTKPNSQPQFVQKSIASKPSNHYSQPQGQPTIYRPKTPERLPQRQPENLALVSQSPPKTTQHRQTHDKPPQALQPHERPQEPQSHERPESQQSHQRPEASQSHERPEAPQSHHRPQALQSHERPQDIDSYDRHQELQSGQVYQSESAQPTDYKHGQALQNHPYTLQAAQKFQPPLHIQSPTPFPVKLVPLQSQGHIPLTYQLPNDKGGAFKPIIYPITTQFHSAQTEASHQPLSLTPTEAAKLYNVKIPSYIKALEEAGQSKPFGFAQMSYGQNPGSYSYSIFNKHS